MKLISIKRAKEIWEASNGNPGEALWVLSGEYNEDDEPLLTTICPEDGFPEDVFIFFVEDKIERDSDYLEVHYKISAFIDKHEDDIKSLEDIQYLYGMGGLWQKAESLTDEFHTKYKDIAWGEELDWHDTLDEFLNEKLL